jgi:hypothetical protein
VVINEVVTDPQQDWSTNNFNGVPAAGAVTSTDEFIELFIRTGGLNLTGWTIELRDSSPVSGTLIIGGAFQTSNYVGPIGTFSSTASGDYLVLGNVIGSASMNDDILIILRDNFGNIIDQVELGDDLELDGLGDGAPDGAGRGGNAAGIPDEAVFRYPNGMDTNNDVADFITGLVTIGQSNDSVVTPTPTPPPPTPVAPLLIGEFLYDGLTPSTEGDEFVELCNPNPNVIDLTGYKVGDEETAGGGESMYQLPISTTLAVDTCLVIAKNAVQFVARFGLWPNYEVIVTGSSYTDDPIVPNLNKYTPWGSGSWSLSNTGDELVVLGPNNEILDSVAYRNGNYATLGLEADHSAPAPDSLQRIWPFDTNSMPGDFVRASPNPGQPTRPPAPPAVPLPATLPGGMFAYWGDLHAHTSYSDGLGPPFYALAMARAAGLHFFAITDHDWWLTEAEWVKTLTQTQQATVPGAFVALRGIEWTPASGGHINVFNNDTLLNGRNDPRHNTLAAFYDWLAANPAAIAQFNHPDPRFDGNFNNFAYHAAAAQMLYLQEVGNHAQGYTTYEPALVQSNTASWRVGPTNNSDSHTSHWGSDSPARTGLVAPALTEADLLAAMRARRSFATEDHNLALALRLNGEWMGSALTATGRLPLTVDWVDPDSEPVTLFLYDGNLPLANVSQANSGQWTTTVEARPGHFFWVKAVQADGDTAYTAPVWLEGQAAPERLVINELLPAPGDWDWDDNGVADYHDEWIELYNPTNRPVGLGGWQLVDSSGFAYSIPLGAVIPASGYAVFYYAQTDLSLNNDGDTLSLIHPNGAVVDIFGYDYTPGYDESWCRLPDAGSTWSEDCSPSPLAANWQKAPAGPLTVKIFEARRLPHNAWVRVKGRVTAPSGVLGSRNMYIQDDTGGILIYLPKEFYRTFNLGDKVEVVGNRRSFHDEAEIVVDERSDVEFLESGLPPPPLPILTTSLLEPYEGMLVQLQGQAVRFQGWATFWVDDGTGPAKTYLRSSTGIKKPYLAAGTPLMAVGIVSQYSDEDEPTRYDYRLLPRYQTDLVITAATPTPQSNWPNLLPETGQQ